jgi:glycosyltransferase 2 family protein
MTRRRPWLYLVIGLGLVATVLALVGDIRELGHRLDQVSWSWVGLAVFLSLANYIIRWLRWQLYLRHQNIALPRASSAIVFGAGLSFAITPAKLGELGKSYLLREMHGVPTAQSIPVVIAERVTDLVALLSLAVVGVSVYGVATSLVLSAGAIIAAGMLLLSWARPAHAVLALLTRPRRLRRLRQPLRAVYADLATMCRPRILALATALSIPAWLCECIGFAVILHAFPDTHVDAGLAIMIYALTTIAGAMSFLPGGLGVTEAAMTLLLIRSGSHITGSTAIAATMLTRFATLWFGVLLGLAFMVAARRRTLRLAAKSSSATERPVAPENSPV